MKSSTQSAGARRMCYGLAAMAILVGMLVVGGCKSSSSTTYNDNDNDGHHKGGGNNHHDNGKHKGDKH